MIENSINAHFPPAPLEFDTLFPKLVMHVFCWRTLLMTAYTTNDRPRIRSGHHDEGGL